MYISCIASNLALSLFSLPCVIDSCTLTIIFKVNRGKNISLAIPIINRFVLRKKNQVYLTYYENVTFPASVLSEVIILLK